MERRRNELLLLILVIMWGSYATATRKLLKETKKGGDSSTGPNPTTITFFMHHITEGATPTATAKPGLGVGGFPTGLQAGNGIGIGIPGFQSPFGNNFNGNGNGPLPLTIPSGTINSFPLFGQLPIPYTTGLGFVPNGGVQGLGSGSGSLTPGLGLGVSVPGIINGQLNPQTGLVGVSGVPYNNVIVIDDILTEGPDIYSSSVLGKGEGYWYHIPTAGAELEDEEEDPNKILLLAFIANFEGSEYEGSSIEFAGKDNDALLQREIAVVGGSGLFHNAQGHALIETVSHTDVETVLKFTVSLTY